MSKRVYLRDVGVGVVRSKGFASSRLSALCRQARNRARRLIYFNHFTVYSS